MGKTKLMFSGRELNSLQDSKNILVVYVERERVGANSILCEGCSMWIHKKCSGLKGRLVEDPTYRCSRCLGAARAIDGRPCDHVMIDE